MRRQENTKCHPHPYLCRMLGKGLEIDIQGFRENIVGDGRTTLDIAFLLRNSDHLFESTAQYMKLQIAFGKKTTFYILADKFGLIACFI